MMPKGYIIVTEEITDQSRLDAYVQAAVPIIMQHGAKILVVDDKVEMLEGSWHGTRTIVLEFESVEAARGWYNSNEYQAVIGERHASAESNMVLVGGFEMPE